MVGVHTETLRQTGFGRDSEIMGCYRVTACFACAAATAAAVLLWGVGAEAVHHRDYLQGGLLLTNALIVTLLESLTCWQYLEWRRARRHGQLKGVPDAPRSVMRRAMGALDTYRRAVIYAALSVPCFVHIRRAWLPIVPGAMVLLSAALYAMKYCCQLRKMQTLAKVSSFVRFKDESVSAEIRETATTSAASAAATAAGAPALGPAAPSLSHHSSFTSGSSVQMGSKDSGIEASQRDVAAGAPSDPAKAGMSRKPKGLVRAYSSSPDRCCLINEDSLSLRD